MARNLSEEALILVALPTETKALPTRWVCFCCKVAGGSVTITDSSGNSFALPDGETFSYGTPDNAKSFESWSFTSDASATTTIVYNK